MPSTPSTLTPGFSARRMKLVVTIPALNEAATIAQVVAGVPRKIRGFTDVEVIVLNDGSTDRTAEEATKAGALVVTLHNRQGLGKVFQTGLERAMRRGADVIVNIDGDGQFNPADIAQLVQPIIDDDRRVSPWPCWRSTASRFSSTWWCGSCSAT